MSVRYLYPDVVINCIACSHEKPENQGFKTSGLRVIFAFWGPQPFSRIALD